MNLESKALTDGGDGSCLSDFCGLDFVKASPSVLSKLMTCQVHSK